MLADSAAIITVLTFVVIAAFIGAIIGVVYYFEARRAKKLMALTSARGFTFRKKATPADQALIAESQLATHGHSRRMWNIVDAAKIEDFAMTLLDYSYTIGYGKSSSVITQTVMRMESPLLRLPNFVMKPESVFAKIGKALGFTDINFPEAPTFSKMYLLRGQDEAAIRQVFNAAIIQYCEQHPKISIEGVGNRLLVYREGRRLKLNNLDSFIDEGKAIVALFVASSQAVPVPSALPPPPPPLMS